MKTRLWTRFLLIPLLLAVALLTFNDAPAAERAKEAKTLKVASVLPLNVGMGVDTKNMLELLAARLNEEGGLTIKGQRYNIELIVYDDKWTAEGGRAAVERLVYQDKVKFITAEISSPGLISSLPVTEPEKVLRFYGATTLKVIENPKYRYAFGPTMVRTSVPPWWSMLRKQFPNAKTVVLEATNDEGGRARAAEETKVAEAFGIKVLDVLRYSHDAVDFSSISARIKDLNPDIVDFPVPAVGTQYGLQLKALYAAGYRGLKIGVNKPKLDEVLAIAGKEAVEGLVCRMPDTEFPDPPPMAKALKQAHIKKYGKWTDSSFTWIPCWYALIAAIRKADSIDTEVIANLVATQGLEFQKVDGKAMMVKRPDLGNNRYCDSCSEVAFGQINDGKLKFIGRVSVDEAVNACERLFGGSWR